MQFKQISQNGQKTFMLIFNKGEEAISGLNSFAEKENIRGGNITGIGAFQDIILGFFDRSRKEYKKIPVREQVEVLTLSGVIALKDGHPAVHAHVVVGKADGTAHGGHLVEAHVWPTLELTLTESPSFLRRRLDPETGLALIDPDI